MKPETAESYWEELREGLDDDLRDDGETHELVVDAFLAGIAAALEPQKPEQRQLVYVFFDVYTEENTVYGTLEKGLVPLRSAGRGWRGIEGGTDEELGVVWDEDNSRFEQTDTCHTLTPKEVL